MSLRFIGGVASRGEALGRSRGGLGTKIVGVCDAAGRLVDFVLTPGQAHELAPSLVLMRRLAVRIEVLKTKVRLHLPRATPDQALFGLLLTRMPRLSI